MLLCVILVVLQGAIDRERDKPKYRCGCACVDPGPAAVGDACRRTECGVQFSTLDQVGSCPIPSPTPWPALVQVPRIARVRGLPVATVREIVTAATERSPFGEPHVNVLALNRALDAVPRR